MTPRDKGPSVTQSPSLRTLCTSVTRDPYSEPSGHMEWHSGELLSPQKPGKSYLVRPSIFLLPLGLHNRGFWSLGLSNFFCSCSCSLLRMWPQLCPGVMRRLGSAGAINPIPGTLA